MNNVSFVYAFALDLLSVETLVFLNNHSLLSKVECVDMEERIKFSNLSLYLVTYYGKDTLVSIPFSQMPPLLEIVLILFLYFCLD